MLKKEVTIATRTFRGTIDANWGTAGNWLEGAVPLNTDDVVFDASSPSCDINSSNRVCLSLTCTGFTNTLTFTFNLDVFAGNIVFVAAMSFAGTGTLYKKGTGNITSNGVTVTVPVYFYNGTITLLDDWIIDADITTANAAVSVTINGFKIYAKKNVTLSNGNSSAFTYGTTELVMNGTGTITQVNSINYLPITIDTTGTTTIDYINGTTALKYITGTTDTTSATFIQQGNMSFDINNMIWDGYMQLYSTGTVTLLSDINFGTSGNSKLTLGYSSQIITINDFHINIGKDFQFGLGAGNGNVNGTTEIIMNGTGLISYTSVTGGLRIPLTINTSGTITIDVAGANVLYLGGVFTYIAGTVITTGSYISFFTGTPIITSGNIRWNKIDMTETHTITLLDNMIVDGDLVLGRATLITTINGFKIYSNANVTKGLTTGQVIGTTIIEYTGTGTINSTGTTSLFNLSEIINTSSGVYNYTGILPRRTSGTFTILKGKLTGIIIYSPPVISHTF